MKNKNEIVVADRNAEIFSKLYQTIASGSNKEAIEHVLASNHITLEEAIKYLEGQCAADEYFKIKEGEKLVSPNNVYTV